MNVYINLYIYIYVLNEYFSSFGKKMNEIEFPPPSAFYNTLTNEPIELEEYLHARNVWELSNLQSIFDYNDLYVKTGVLLLTDDFQNFSKLCHEYYKTYCIHLLLDLLLIGKLV